MKNRRTCLLASLTLLGTVAACGTNGQGMRTGDSITAGNDVCSVGMHQVKAGHATFHVKNTGSRPTDVAVYTENDQGEFKMLLGRARDVAPGSVSTIGTTLPQGQYRVVCTPASGRSMSTVLRAVMVEEGKDTVDHAYDKLYQFQVTQQGRVSSEPDLAAKAGQTVKLEVFNHTRAQYKLLVENSLHQQVAALVAPPQQMGQTNVELDTPGQFKVEVSPAGSQSVSQSFPLTVRK